MKFEVVNSSNQTVMQCEEKVCIPTIDELNAMNKAGYKFKLDNKFIVIKKIKELIKE